VVVQQTQAQEHVDLVVQPLVEQWTQQLAMQLQTLAAAVAVQE
jgi:hypothetical protein